MDEKIIFIDIDGTLTLPGANVPPDSAVDAIRAAQAKGHRIFLCTGRNYDMLSPLLKYNFDGFIGSSGGYISCKDQVIFDCPMTEEQRVSAMHVLEKNHILRTVECYDGSYIDAGLENLLQGNTAGNSEFLRWRKQLEESLHMRPMTEYRGQPVYKIVFMCNSQEQLTEPQEILQKDFMFVVQEPNQQGIINGELVNRKFDKGQAVSRVCEYLGKTPDDTIGFGDSMNDLEMFQAVNYAVCMENGSERLKKQADRICPAVEKDGLKRAFEELGLI